MALGRPLGAKLFLEGIEVPLIGATITCAVGQASIAYVDVVPHQEIMNIKPRTRVDIFVRNYQDEGPNCVFPYVLAWQGEVFGINFGRTPASRTMSLSCIDLTGYWDCMLTYYFNTKQSMGAGSLDRGSQINSVMEATASGTHVQTTMLTEASFYKQKISEVMGQKYADGTAKDFLDGIVAIYESIGFTNDFFAAGNHRLRISDQIVMHSSKALLELLKDKEGYDWFVGQTDTHSGFSTLRQVIDGLLGMIFHDCVTIPFPSPVVRGTKDRPFAKESSSDTTVRNGLPSSDGLTRTVGSFAVKPNLFMMPPPMCNIFFPDEYSSFQFSRNFFKEPTRLTYMPELPARLGGGGAAVYLPHVYEPPAYEYYMNTKSGDYKKYQGVDSVQVPKLPDPGHSMGEDSNEDRKKLNSGVKRQWNFMTNEEYIKGIWNARESMMPGTTKFRTDLDKTGGERQAFTKKVAKYLFYKRRFQDRTVQITSHLKLSVVPGFSVLILDDSSADQNITAYCSSVTHRIYATEGGYTNVQLSYAKYVAEEDEASTHGSRFLIPPWMDKTIFGEITVPDINNADKTSMEVAKLGSQGVYPKKLSSFFEALLGKKGSMALSSYAGTGTVLEAVRKLQKDYQEVKRKGAREVEQFIASLTARDYIKMKDFYKFLGAETKTAEKDLVTTKWVEFNGEVFTRPSSKPDAGPIKLKRDKILKYRDALKEQRGFRG